MKQTEEQFLEGHRLIRNFQRERKEDEDIEVSPHWFLIR